MSDEIYEYIHRNEVYVGNIGCVYSGRDEAETQRVMGEYIRQSRTGYGRAAGESVTLFVDGEIEFEYTPENRRGIEL